MKKNPDKIKCCFNYQPINNTINNNYSYSKFKLAINENNSKSNKKNKRKLKEKWVVLRKIEKIWLLMYNS